MKHKRSQMIASHAQDPDFSAQPEENSPGRHRIRTYIRTAYQQDVTVAHPETASLLHCIGHTLTHHSERKDTHTELSSPSSSSPDVHTNVSIAHGPLADSGLRRTTTSTAPLPPHP